MIKDILELEKTIQNTLNELKERIRSLPENNEIKAFWHFKRQDYYTSCLLTAELAYEDEILIGDYSPEGGVETSEFSIRWREVGGEVIPRLDIYSEAWVFFKEYAEFFLALSEVKEGISPIEVCKILVDRGFTDKSDIPLEEFLNKTHID